MIVYIFMEQFAERVRRGLKPCTIRPLSAKVPFIGQPVSLRQWSDKPYRSIQIELRQAYICRVQPISINAEGSITLARKSLDLHNSHRLAELDGFESAHDMVNWFYDNHGLPFKGILIEWDDVPRLYEGCTASRIFSDGKTNPHFEDAIVLAIRGKYAMYRFPRCTPAVLPVNELRANNFWFAEFNRKSLERNATANG